MYAVVNGRDQVFRALIERGADVYAVDITGRSALRYGLETLCRANAATDSDVRRAKICVKYLSELLPAQPEDQVLTDIVLGRHDALESRLKNGLDANAMITGGLGILTISQETVGRKLAKQLSEGPITETIISNQWELDRVAESTPLLMWAVAAKQPSCVSVLLSHGADPEQINADGVSAFTLSRRPSCTPEIRTLIRNAL
jgi:hypothetical protein